jgi:hypothetical protein
VIEIRRRLFLKRALGTTLGFTCADFLSFFLRFGLPPGQRAEAMARDRSAETVQPRFLIYWFLEGGWMGYDMFNPVVTDNNVVHRLEDVSAERYRVLHFGEEGYRIQRQGNIRYGYLAAGGKELFPEMSVLSSMETGSFHSGERLKAHMGSYNLKLTAEREEDERSVTQAFAEALGRPYLLPNLSWHWWLSDGELNEVQYTGRRGYYHALGPAHAHTIYAGTPLKLKTFLQRMQASASDAVNREIRRFLDDIHAHIRDDAQSEAIQSYHSAREIYRNFAERGGELAPEWLDSLFNDPRLREEFKVEPEDELITYRSINGQKARSKFSPSVNVQAMMAYELMRAGLSCVFWIESRDIRVFDSHFSRGGLWQGGKTAVGMPDQTSMMRRDLWTPLKALVKRLKETQYKDSGKSLFDLTTIVITSEFGRTIHGDVQAIQKMPIADGEKSKLISGQDISQHWKVTSAAFLGGNVSGNTQFGRVGEKTIMPIPILPNGMLDPAFHPITGEPIPGREKNPHSWVPNHGDVYATALYLADINPRGRGKNDRGPLPFVRRDMRSF